jgi:hypothetical protein
MRIRRFGKEQKTVTSKSAKDTKPPRPHAHCHSNQVTKSSKLLMFPNKYRSLTFLIPCKWATIA